ncbi:MAG: hypothetical protein HY905_14185 [Deltaproteobacteria bacterium]|nr:hypothetical protein [Deltaproteobacteria bacterium]
MADPAVLDDPSRSLEVRIPTALEFYGCDLLFVHRDAEAVGLEARLQEIGEVVARCSAPPPVVCVVPVRMTEAWLLTDEAAIRRAAGNPNGTVPLSLPPTKQIESVPNPKNVLARAIQRASGLSGRRLESLRRDSGRLVHRVAELHAGFAALRALPAFASFEERLREILEENGWTG